jgi:hypothetical protein
MGRFGRFRHTQAITDRKGEFNPDDATKVKHIKFGVWDYYEEKNPEMQYVPASSHVESFMALYKDFPFFLRMLRDVASLKSCQVFLLIYIIIGVIESLIPSASLWYSGQLLSIVRTRIEMLP